MADEAIDTAELRSGRSIGPGVATPASVLNHGSPAGRLDPFNQPAIIVQ